MFIIKKKKEKKSNISSRYVNFNEGIERLNENSELYIEILKSFQLNIKTILKQLKNLVIKSLFYCIRYLSYIKRTMWNNRG